MRFRRAACFFALLTVVQLACVSPGAPGIEGLVRSATTPADHREIAEYYRMQADAAQASIAEHRRLAQLYDGRQSWGVLFADRLTDHCDRLAMLEDATAAEYELLAAEHERLANE